VSQVRSLMSVVGAVVVLAGCYHVTVETGLAPSPTIIDQPFALGFVYGLIPPPTVNTMARCPKGVAKVESQMSFLNGLVSAFTFSLLTPMHITVTCALDGTTRAAADGSPVIQVGARSLRDAIVTAAKTGASPYLPGETVYYLACLYDVNLPSLTVSFDGYETGIIGTITVNVATTVPEVVAWEGSLYGWELGTDPVTLNVHQTDLQSDGKLSIWAMGIDNTYTQIAYGVLTDLTFVNGMTVNLTIDQTNFTDLTYTLDNVPSGALQAARSASANRKKGDNSLYLWGYDMPPIPPAVFQPAVSGYGDYFEYDAGLSLDQDGDGLLETTVTLYRGSQTFGDQTFDFSQSLPAPSNFAIGGVWVTLCASMVPRTCTEVTPPGTTSSGGGTST